MFKSLLKLGSILTRQDLRRLGALFAVVVLMALLETAGIASILPFLYLASDPESIQRSTWLKWIYSSFGFSSHRGMLLACGWSVIGLLAASNTLAAVSIWQRQRIAWSIAHSVSLQLIRSYTSLSYEYFLTHNSADLIRKIISDVNNLVTGVLLAGSQLLTHLIVASAIFFLLLWVQPAVAIVAFFSLACLYLAIYLTRRKYLTGLGQEQLVSNSARYRTFVELVSGIKAIRCNGVTEYFVDRFEVASKQFTDIHPKVQFTSSVPRYFVETLAFGGVVAVIVYLVGQEQDFVSALPTVTLFALAGYRLMPSLNGVYTSIAQMLSSYPAIDNIHEDIAAVSRQQKQLQQPCTFQSKIAFKSVSFRYQQSDTLVVDDITLTIPKGDKVAFVGPTGSGKTTLIDILTGLLQPTTGQMLVDDEPFSAATLRGWQDITGYVPQEVFLYDATIAENIAFGLGPVDTEQIREVCEIAQLSEFIENELVDSYATEIGERGSRLSGGQRQRLGLARALYRRPEVLVLDEATSALDSATEASVIQAIHDRLPGMTIIMIAHRITTVQNCNRLYVIDRGKLTAEGSYEELVTSSRLFRDLARFT